MAMSWITKIVNHTSSTIRLYQNDPSKHPVINGRQYLRDVPIEVPPHTEINDISWFVIPWTAYGRLLVEGPSGRLEFTVGPVAGEEGDFLLGFNERRQRIVKIGLGAQGNEFISTSEWRLDISDTNGVQFFFIKNGWQQNAGELMQSMVQTTAGFFGIPREASELAFQTIMGRPISR